MNRIFSFFAQRPKPERLDPFFGSLESLLLRGSGVVTWLRMRPVDVALQTAAGKTRMTRCGVSALRFALSRRWPVALAAALVFLGARPRARPPNVIVLMIDTLRADAVGIDEKARERTPFLGSLADHGNVFTRAYATTSWTSPSVASLYTSRYQSQHHVLTFGSQLPESETTLAEIFKAHGYATVGFTANPLVRGTMGYGQGFDRYRLLSTFNRTTGKRVKVRARALHRAALRWLDEREERSAPVLLYLHYMDPHWPYDPPTSALEGVGDTARDDPKAATRKLYGGEVRGLDTALEELFAALKSRQLLQDTIVAIVADHGEEFWEHGRFGHGGTLFDEVLRVPMLIIVPGQTAQVTVDRTVSTIDLAPTLVQLAGLPDVPSFEGRSLDADIGDGWTQRLRRSVRRLIQNGERRGTAYAELLAPSFGENRPVHTRAVVRGSFKLLEGKGGISVFDLRADPMEQEPLDPAVPERDTLESILSSYERYAVPSSADEPALPDAGTLELMRSLGYAN